MKTVSVLLLAGLLMTGTACHTSRKSMDHHEARTATAVTGTVTAIEQGKDGYTATIESEGKSYKATVSHANLKDPAQYRSVHQGEKITVTGELWMLEQEAHITVRELR